jgi:hypothetical protein
MRNIVKGLALTLSASFLIACGGNPFSKALDHEIAMLKIVEANKTDAAKAASELDNYLKTNEAAVKADNEALAKLRADLKASNDKDKGMSLMKDAASKLKEVSDLEKKLREEAKDVFRDEKVSKLLDTVQAF